MGKRTPLLNDFRSGEMTPGLGARSDLKTYSKGCMLLENCMPIPEGGVERVPGTRYVKPSKLTEEGWCLRVVKSGSGNGLIVATVDGIEEGINCGSTCYIFYQDGTTVVLTETPDVNCIFKGWSGDGTGTGSTRTVVMNGNKTVGTLFELPETDSDGFVCYGTDYDATHLYLAGSKYLNGEWFYRVEKRLISTGALVSTLHTKNGLAASITPRYFSVKVDDDYIYAGGMYYEVGITDEYAVVHKISKSTLESVIWEYKYATQTYRVQDLVLDSDYVYFTGASVFAPLFVLKGKLSKSDGSSVWVKNDTTAQARGISTDGTRLYIIKDKVGEKAYEVVGKDGTVITDAEVADDPGGEDGFIGKGSFDVDGVLYAAGNNLDASKGIMCAINMLTGMMLWETLLDVGGQNDVLVKCAGIDDYFAYAGGTSPSQVRAYIACYDKMIGSVIWEANHENPLAKIQSIILIGDYLYLPLYIGSVAATSVFRLEKRIKNDGALVWSVK